MLNLKLLYWFMGQRELKIRKTESTFAGEKGIRNLQDILQINWLMIFLPYSSFFYRDL